MQRVQRLLELIAVLCATSTFGSVARGGRASEAQSDVAGSVLEPNPAPVVDETQKMVDAAENSAWQTAGKGTEVRSHSQHLRAAVASRRASEAARTAGVNVANTMSVPPQASNAEQQAKTALQEAISWHTKAQTLINGVQQRAYFAAKAVASAEAAKLEAEAQAYYQTLVAASQALGKKTWR